MTIKGLKKKTVATKKRQTLKFTVDCAIPVADNVIDAAGLVSVAPVLSGGVRFGWSRVDLFCDDNSFPV